MGKIKFFAGITLIFLLGALAGALGTGFFFKEHVEEFIEGGPPKEKIMRRLTKVLELTPEQQKKIEPILAEAHRSLLDLKQRSFPEMRRIREESFALIKKELNPEQQKKLEDLKKKLKKHGPRLPPSSPPPPPPKLE